MPDTQPPVALLESSLGADGDRVSSSELTFSIILSEPSPDFVVGTPVITGCSGTSTVTANSTTVGHSGTNLSF